MKEVYKKVFGRNESDERDKSLRGTSRSEIISALKTASSTEKHVLDNN